VRIYTAGHSTRSAEEFLELLHAWGVRRVVDVRRYPGSRRHPHFSREQLDPALARAGIAYVHAVELGGRRTPAPDSPNSAWRSASFRAYADHMGSAPFQEWLERLIGWAAGGDTAIMCAEAVPWRCHRQLIADALVARGVEVLDITAPDRATPHALSPHARVGADGGVTYPAPSGEAPPDEQQSLF
jgi:uncharacterized protein (DUF488 family)